MILSWLPQIPTSRLLPHRELTASHLLQVLNTLSHVFLGFLVGPLSLQNLVSKNDLLKLVVPPIDHNVNKQCKNLFTFLLKEAFLS